MSDATPDAAFEAVLSLIALVADPARCKVRLADLQKSTAELRELETKLAAERGALDGRAAELDAREKELSDRRADIEGAARERLLESLHPQPTQSRDPNFPEGSSLVREPYTEPPPVDAHYPLAAIEPPPPRNKAIRVSR